MATENSPPERDVKDFKFQQLCKIRISPPSGEIKTDRLQWLATSSRYGFTFIGEKSGFKVIKTNTILLLDQEHSKDRSNCIIEDFPVWSTIELSAHVSHLALSCDELTLIVAVKECANLLLLAYDIRGFANQNAKPPPFQKVKLNASPGSTLLDLAWNPGNPLMLATCVSDGGVELFEIKENLHMVASLPVSTCATCLCWSPKGKQIVIGLKDGSLIQFDQELKAKKKWTSPTVLEGPQQVVDVSWLSTYMFLAAYVPSNAQDSDQPFVVLTICSKDGKTEFCNYEDICYGSGENRKHKYYISFIQQWELAVIASSNATETTIVGKHLEEKTNWEHWTLEDSGRAELPLADSDCDSFPVAMAIDYSSQMTISLGDNKTHPPSPIVLLLSTDGLLVPFHMLYMRPDVVQLNKSPEPLPASGDRTPRGSPTQTATTASTVITGSPFGQRPFETTATPTSSGLPLPFGQPPSAPPQAAAAAATTAVPSATSGLKLPQPKAASASVGQPSKPPQSAQVTSSSSSGAGSTLSEPGATGAFGRTQTPAAGTTAGSFGLPTTGNSFQFVTKSAQQTNPAATSTAGSPLEFSLRSGRQVAAKAGVPDGVPAVSTTQSSAMTGFTFSTQTTRKAAAGNSFTLPNAAPKGDQSPSGGVAMFQLTKPQTPQTALSAAGQSLKFTTPLTTASSEASAVSAQVEESSAATEIPEPDTVSEPVSSTTQAPAEEGEDAEALRQRTKSASEAIESAFTKSILEEMTDFVKELKAHKAKVKTGISHVGTQEEMQKLRRATDEITQFCNGIKDTTKDQSREVHDIKILCIDLIAMAEECRVRQQRNTDPKYHQLLRSRALDPTSAEQLRDLQQQYQLLQHSLQEVDLVLDAQWDEYKSNKASKGRIQTPTRDAIYRVVKSNCNLIEGQKNVIDGLQEQLKHLKLFNRSSGWQNMNNSFSSANCGPDLSLLVDSAGEQRSRSSSSLNQSQSISISPEKQARLREYLSRRTVPKVKSTVPANLSMSKIVSAQRLRDAFAAADDARSNRVNLPPPTPVPSRTTSRDRSQPLPSGPQSSQASQASQLLKSRSPATEVAPAQSLYNTPTLPKSTALSSFGPTAFTGQAFFKKLQPPTTSTSLTSATALAASSLTTTVASSTKVSSSAVSATGMKSVFNISKQPSGFSTVDKTSLPSKTPVLSEIRPRVLEFNSDKTTQDGTTPSYEDISPAGTPDVESEDQDALTGEDEYEDEEEEYEDDDDDDDDEEEAGFGLEYELGSDSVRTAQSDEARNTHTERDSSVQVSRKPSELVSNMPAVSKNLFGGGDTPSSSSLFQTKAQTFTFGGSSGASNKSLFGLLSSSKDTSTTEQSVDKSVSGIAAGTDTKTSKEEVTKSSASGFSFLNVTVPSTQSSTAGFSFKTANTSTREFSFGGDVGIFSSTAAAKSETSKSSSMVSAFGGGSFGGSSPTTSPTALAYDSAVVSSAAGSSFITTDSNKGTDQLTDSNISNVTATSSTAENAEISSVPATSAVTIVETSAEAIAVTPAQPDSTAATSSSVPSKPSILEGLLGKPVTTTSTGGFGQASTTATTAQTTSAPDFGGGDAALGSSSIPSFATLGNTAPASSTTGPTTSASLFTGLATSTSSMFGGQSTTTSTSIFGGSAAVTMGTSGFGSGTSSVFGESNASAGSIFGGNTATTSSSLFGNSATTATSSGFGSTAATSSSLFGSAEPTTSSPLFGNTAATTGSVFGDSTAPSSLFGGKSTTTPTLFGGGTSTTNTSVFGAPAAFGSFGGSSSSPGFGTQPSTTSESNAFGSGGALFGGLGGKPSAEKANTNVFGGNQTFGATAENQSSLFGKNTPAFGVQNTSSSVFGGSFTSGGGSVASSGFGVTQTQPSSVSFGDTSTFGGNPAFGTAPAFGSKPAFGSSATFGGFASPTFSNPVGSVFGASSTAQGSNFASFAESSSPSFGALAQSSDVPSFGAMAQTSTPGFGAATGFGSGSPAPPTFGGAPANPSPSLSPQFTSYRG